MKILFFIACMLVSFISVAQDIIYKKDKTKIEAKILAVGLEDVRYLKQNNLTGPEYVLQKSEITLISYLNGSYENFESSVSTIDYSYPINNYSNRTDYLKTGLDTAFKQNILNYNLGDLLSYNFTLSYERISKNGMLGIKVPLRVGFGGTDYGQDLLYSGGLDLNFYPTGQGRLKYFVGPALEAGSIQYQSDYYYYNAPYPPYGYNIYKERFFVAGYVNNGAMLQITKQFSLSSTLGIGIRSRQNNQDFNGEKRYADLIARFEFNLGIRL